MENGIFLFVCIGLIAAWGESDGKLLTGEELLSCSLADFYTSVQKATQKLCHPRSHHRARAALEHTNVAHPDQSVLKARNTRCTSKT